MPPIDAPLGVIAGRGALPRMLVEAARKRGERVVAIVFDRESHDQLAGVADETHLVGLAQAGKTIETLKAAGVKRVAFIGKVDKRVLFENPRFDMKALSILRRLDLKNDDAVMGGIVDALEREGFEVADQAQMLRSLMPPAGCFTRSRPTAEQQTDIAFGLRMAKGIGALDIGQTVVVKDGAVIAVEAIDGTDETIRRAGPLCKGGGVVCKVAKPRQDQRFDIPAVGEGTVAAMIDAGMSALAIEAERTLVVGVEEVAAACERAGIVFVAAAVEETL
ncbi:MAG: UDP-2,3-diacylglucosamine diphosphatase LpxI [Nitrospinae bacterium]|nr:UDP-2,3-diacylglucosamine diphosphatase LpxI [Nitrospinota bacterium]